METIEVGDLVKGRYTNRYYILIGKRWEANVEICECVDFDGNKRIVARTKLIKVNKNT